jgi:hypothetical protein
VVIDGELVETHTEIGEALPGPTVDDLRHFYLMARWQARSKGLNDGWGFYATQRRFKLNDQAAKRVKRNCMRATECGEEAWSEAASR